MTHFLKKIVKNQLFKVASLNSLSIIVRIITGFVSSKAISYFIGPSGMALMGNLRNFTSLLENIGILGLQNGIVKHIAQENQNQVKNQEFIASLFWIFLILASVLSVILFLGNDFFGKQIFGIKTEYYFIINIIAIVLPIQIFHLFFVSILNGFFQYKKVTILTIYSYILGLCVSVFLMYFYKINGALISIAILSIFQIFYSGYYFFIAFPIKILFNNRKINSKHIKQILPLGFMTLFSGVVSPIIYIYIRNLITKETSIEEAGFYEAMQRISGFYMMFILTLISFYFLPEIAKAKTVLKEQKLIFSFYKGIIPIFGIGLVIIYFFRNFIIQILLTKEFELVSELFFYQLIGDFFKALSLILGICFYAKKIIKDYFLTEIFSFIILLVSSTLLIKLFEVEGAVMAHAITYIVYFFVLLIYFRKTIFFKKSTNNLVF
jgi:O-antigen/teichoic acid export membrane protein